MKPPKPDLHPSSGQPAAHDQTAPNSRVDDIALSPDADTVRLVALSHNEKLSLEDSLDDTIVAPFDPYNKAGNNAGARQPDNKPRKSIDDLRKLSAEITKAKHYPPKRK